MTTAEELRGIPGAAVAPPADEVDLAVADALLPTPLPAALRAFLAISDGVRVGATEVLSAAGITEATTNGGHTWELPDDTVVVGRAGGRSLVMLAGRGEVYEIDDDPWDARTIEPAADSPLDLLLRHHGVPLRDREPWWALPGLAPALDEAREGLTRDTDALLGVGIASRAGRPLPAALNGFDQVSISLAREMLTSEDLHMLLLNHRPTPPVPGHCAAVQWQHACDELVDPSLRDLIRDAPLPEAYTAIALLDDEQDSTVADAVRDLALFALLAKARDDLADILRADHEREPSLGHQLAHVFLNGHVPVNLTRAI